MAHPASAAVPSLRQTNLFSPIVQNPTVSSRNFGSAVATNENGTRSVIGEWGTTGTGSDAHVYECSASGCAFSTSLNALASRTVTITQYQVTGNKATVTTSAAHGFLPGEKITISGTGSTLFNVTNQVISDVTTNTISFYKNTPNVAATAANAGATGTVDLAPANSGFGFSVDMSDDGNLILVGAPSFDVSYYQYTTYTGGGSGSNVNRRFGRAYLYEFISGAWVLAKIFDRASPVDLGNYGTDVSIAGNGATAAIGSNISSGTNNPLEVHVNTPNPSASPGPSGTAVFYSSWVLQQTITVNGGGQNIDLSDDGAIIVANGPNVTSGAANAGSAYIYTKGASSWSLTKTLIKSNISGQTSSVNEYFGYDVAVSDDGLTVAALSYQSTDIYIYRYSGGAWGTPVNIATSALVSRTKTSIALSANGNVAMVGIPEITVGCYKSAGAVAFFEYSSGTWAQNGGLRTSDQITSGEYFGRQVALSEDGSSFAITGSSSSSASGVTAAGKATLFHAFLSNTESLAPTLTLQQGCTNTFSSTTTVLQKDPTNSNSIIFTLTADEALDPTSVTSSDFTVTNGTVSSISCDSTICRITVTAVATGDVVIAPSGSFSVSDIQGNAATTAGGTDRTVTYDGSAPTLLSSTPADNATSVTLSDNIVLNFSEPVFFQASISISIVRDRPASNSPNGLLTYESFLSTSARVTGSGTSTLTIDPTNDLLPGYSYFILVGANALKDTSGNAFTGLTTNTDLNFSVTADTVAPTLASSSPADNSTGFGVASNLVLNFSEDIFYGGTVVKSATGTSGETSITVPDASGILVGQYVFGTTGIASNATVTSVSGNTVNLSVANVGAVSGNVNFRAVIQPTVTGTNGQSTITVSNSNGISIGQGVTGTGIALNAVVTGISGTTITLSSANTGTVSGTGYFFQPLMLRKVSDGSVVQVFAYTSTLLTWSLNTLTINPTNNLAYLTDYYLTIPGNFIKDVGNNYYTGINSNTDLNFTTAGDTVAPTVVSVSPVDNLTTVAVNQNLILTFSEIVNQGTGSIVIKLLSDASTFESIPVSDPRISGWGTSQITIDPSGAFTGSSSYYVNIPSGAILDTAGNTFVGITNSTSWNFTAQDSTPPSLVSISTNSGGTLVTLQYNENLASVSSYRPATTQFSVSIGGVSSQPTSLTVLNNTISLALGTTINPADVVTLTYTDSALTGDIQDLAYNDAPSFTAQAVTNVVLAKVTNVTSSTANGTFVPGDPISIQVVFSGPVTVTGTPTLLLETGSVDRLASYASGTGTNTLTFNYTVQTGDGSADLDYNSTGALALSGGTITNTNGAATLTLPTPGAAGSLGANKALVITSGPLTLNISPSSFTYTDTSINDDFLDTTGTASGIGAGTYVFGITGGTTYPTSSTTPPNTAVVKYTVGKTGTYGTLWLVNTTEATYNNYNGNWRFVPNDAAINALTTTATETFVVTLDNGTNTVTNNITFTFVGVNDRPTVAISTTPSNDFSPVPGTTTCGFDTPYAVDFGEMPNGETCNYAFDNQDGTKFLNFDQTSSLLIDAGAIYTLTGIGMTTGNDLVSRDPVTFTIYGSNVSRTSGMTKIATISNVAAPIERGAIYPVMNFTNSSSYRYYRIKWDSVRSPLDANSIQIAEIRLIGFSGGTLTYSEGQPGQVLESGFTLNDLDGQIVSATIKISTGLTTGDLLSLTVDPTTMGGITPTYTASTGLLTLSGSATATQYQAALRAVKYSSTSTNPTALYSSRTVSWEISDSTGLKNTSVITSIAVISVNDVPVLTDLTAKSIPERAAAQSLDSSVTLTDGDSPNYFEGSIRVTGLLDGDVVSISSTTASAAGAIRKAGLEIQWSDGNTWQKIGTVSGGVAADLLISFTTTAATRAIVESVIEALLISSSSSVATRTLTITVDDGDGGVSVGGTIVVTITDGTPPTVTLIPALIKNTGSVVATSNEAGKIYLVRADQTVTTEASILALLDFMWNVVSGVLADTSASIDATGLSNGSFVAYAVDAAGNLSVASADVAQISGSAPTAGVLSSIISPSKASSFLFQLAFSEAITGLASTDFSNTGTATGCVFTPSAAAGSSFNVTVTSCSEGTLTLRLAPNSVVDSATNAGPPSAVTSTAITIDRTAPTLSWTSPAATVTALPLTYTLTFSESITGLTSSDFINANATSAKAVGCVFTPSANSGTVITVSVTGCSDGILALRLNANSVADAAGNLGTAANSNASVVTIDRAAPVVTWLTPITAGFTTSTSITPNWTVTDGISLNASGTVSMMRATLTGDTCGSYTSQGAQTKNAATTLTTGYCYYWTFSAAPSDTAGNVTTGSSLDSVVVKVDSSGTIVTLTAPFAMTTYAPDQPIIFDVTFSRNITGIESGDFVNQGTATGCLVTPQGNSYLTSGAPLKVHVTNCSEGTLILELSANSVFHSTNVAAPGVPFRATSILIDRTAPTVIAKSPVDGSSSVAVGANVILTFSEVINSQIGAISLRKLGGELVQRLSVSDSQVTGFGTDSITIDFDGDLATNTTYYLEIEPGAVMDQSGLPFAGYSGPANLIFTTAPGLAQTITMLTTFSKLTTDTPFAPGATTSSDLPITYSSSNTSIATIVDGLVVILTAGSTVITASQSGNSAYEAAEPVTATLTVTTPTPSAPPSGGGGGGGGAPAPVATPVEVPEEVLTKLWGTDEATGLRIRWEGTTKPVKIVIISSINEKFEVESDKLESGELLNTFKPGLAYSISAIPLASKKFDSQQTIAYALPPLAPVSLSANQSGLNLVAMSWEQPGYAEKFRVTVTPNVGDPLIFTTTDKNLRIDVAKGRTYKISVVAIGAKNLESTVSVFNWTYKGILQEGTYAFASGANNTIIAWTLLPGEKAEKYRAIVRGKVLCETADTTCTVKGLYGGNSNLTIVALNGSTSVAVDQIVARYIPASKFRLVGRIYFDGFSSNIAATYTKKIKEMAAFVLVSGFSEVQISGHSDQFKNAPLVNNSALSTKRAVQVADAMKKLLPKVKFSAVGRGNNSPLKKGKYQNPKNRRVQIYTR